MTSADAAQMMIACYAIHATPNDDFKDAVVAWAEARTRKLAEGDAASFSAILRRIGKAKWIAGVAAERPGGMLDANAFGATALVFESKTPYCTDDDEMAFTAVSV